MNFQRRGVVLFFFFFYNFQWKEFYINTIESLLKIGRGTRRVGAHTPLKIPYRTMTFNGQSENVYILAGICPLDNLYLTGKPPLLVGDMMANFGDILPETSKSSACWEMRGNSHLTWLSCGNLHMP